ncbi:hypothetical protein EON65_12025 [archaeon]|nr:MAG: hypothetical protein EON65_12025 [archaeon]
MIICAILLLYLVQVGCQTTQVLTAVTGTISCSILTVGDLYQWEITPHVTASSIQIIFESLSNLQAEFRIFDKSSSRSGTLLWNCVSCGSLLPPPFTSSTGAVIVYAKAVSGVSFFPSSFLIRYVAYTKAPNIVYKNLTLNLNMGYASLTPYAVDGRVAASSVQRWNIRLSTPTTQRISFTFDSYNLSASCDDRLQIYDQALTAANLIFDNCRADLRQTIRWLYASSGKAIIVFQTGSSASTAGSFSLDYFVDTDLFNCGSFLQPGKLTADSMQLVDGSTSTSLMRRGVSCSWLITSSKASSISLIFDWVSLKFGSSVNVYDSNSTSGFLLWNGIGATFTVPPVITSTSSSLFVSYFSDSTDPVIYRGFLGKYQSNYLGSQGLGTGYTNLAMSSALDIMPPGDRKLFSSGVNYTWYVTPSRATGPLTFTFNFLNLTSPSDKIKIYDGLLTSRNASLLAVFSGSEIPTRWIQTRSSQATVLFETPSTQTSNPPAGNLQLAYYADGSNYHCGFTRNPARLTMPSWIITDGSSSRETVFSDADCIWDIQPFSGNVSSLFISFDRFSLTGGLISISVGSPSTGYVFTSISDTSIVPPPMLLIGNRFTIRYGTANKPLGFGFSLTYYGINNPTSFPGDNVVRLLSSTVYSLSSARAPGNVIEPNTNLTWIVSPSVSSGRIYFALSSLSFQDCNASLRILDGRTIDAPQLATICGASIPMPYKWITTTSTMGLLTLSSSQFGSKGDFEISYYSDGLSYHCGFLNNPAILTAPSFIFSDGSASTNRMYSGQQCQWIIRPNIFSDSSLPPLIVIDFIELDVRGGSIVIYAGYDSSGEVIWNCTGCSYLPSPLLIRGSSVYVQYISFPMSTLGTGFTAIYWTTNAGLVLDRTPEERLLQVPIGFNLDALPYASSASFKLFATASVSRLSSYAKYDQVVVSDALSSNSNDGRPPQSVFESRSRPEKVCGILSGSYTPPVLSDDKLSYTPTQSSLAYIKGLTDSKPLYKLQEAGRNGAADGGLVVPASVCKYHISSGSTQAVVIRVNQVSGQGRLRIFGGVYGNDSVFDSYSAVDLELSNDRNLTIPCGVGFVVYEGDVDQNATTFRLEYSLLPEAKLGNFCQAYSKLMYC